MATHVCSIVLYAFSVIHFFVIIIIIITSNFPVDMKRNLMFVSVSILNTNELFSEHEELLAATLILFGGDNNTKVVVQYIRVAMVAELVTAMKG